LFGKIYISDTGNNRILIFDADLNFTEELNSIGNKPFKFNAPRGIDVDNAGFLYVANSGSNQVLVFDPERNFVNDLTASGAPISSPWDVAVDRRRNIYVSSNGNGKVLVISAGYTLIAEITERLTSPWGIDVDDNGSIFVVDGEDQRVKTYDAQFAFDYQWGPTGKSDGLFRFPLGITVKDGMILVTDRGENSVREFDISSVRPQYLSKWGGTGVGGGQFLNPAAVDVDASGKVYVLDKAAGRLKVFVHK